MASYVCVFLCKYKMIIAETCCTNDEDEDEFPSLSTSNPGTLPLKQPQHEFDFHFYVIEIETGTVCTLTTQVPWLIASLGDRSSAILSRLFSSSE